MKTKSIAAAFAAAAVAAAGAITALSAPIAVADDINTVNTTHLGSQAELTDGDVVQGWTVTGLKVSTDAIPYQPQGTLWEATATDKAIQGSAQPIVSNFNARARDGQTYRALFGVATAQGVNPSAIAQGQQTSGKIYFDVTGSTPDSVVYATNATDLIVWVTPPPAPSGGAAASGTRTYPSATTPSTSSTETSSTATSTTETSTTPTPGAPAGAQATTPAPTTVPAGSQGTPLPEGAAETAQVPAGSQGTPLPEGQPGMTPAGLQEAPAPAAVAPAPEGTAPVPAAPAAVEGTLPGDEARIDGGSQGTPLPEGAAPTTTPVMAPPA